MTGASGGATFDAVATGKGVFERLRRETSGRYLLGVDPPPGIEFDKPLDVVVRARRPGVTVRSSRQVILPAPDRRPPEPKDTLRLALRQPLTAREAPLGITAFVARRSSSDPGQFKAFVVADAGDGSRGRPVAWGYEIRDGERIVADSYEEVKNHDPDHPSRTVLFAPAALPTGVYTLRVAVTDATGRRGMVERGLDVRLRSTGPIQVSDLFTGEIVDDRFRPRIVADARASSVAGLLELYADDNDGASLVVEFSLVGVDGTERAKTESVAVKTGTKWVAVGSVPIHRLAPGTYDLVARVILRGTSLGTLRRAVGIGVDF